MKKLMENQKAITMPYMLGHETLVSKVKLRCYHERFSTICEALVQLSFLKLPFYRFFF